MAVQKTQKKHTSETDPEKTEEKPSIWENHVFWAFVSYTIVIGIALWCFYCHQQSLRAQFQERTAVIARSIESLKPVPVPQYILLTSTDFDQLEKQRPIEENLYKPFYDTKHRVDENQADNYHHFLTKYYERQSQTLNIWLAVVAGLVGFMAIVIPIMFSKFIESKKEDFRNLEKDFKDLQKTLKEEEKEMKTELRDSSSKSIAQVTEGFLEKKIAIEKMEKETKAILSDVQAFSLEMKERTYFSQGVSEFNSKNNETARDMFSKVLDLNKNNSLAYTYRGKAFFRLKNYKDALKDFSQSLDRNKNDYVALKYSVATKYNLNQYDSALEDVEKALEKRPSDTFVHYIRGMINTSQGKIESAEKDLVFMKKNNGASISILKLEGAISVKIPHYKDAVDIYTKLLEKEEEPQYIYLLAKSYMFIKRYTKSLENFQKLKNGYPSRKISKSEYDQLMAELKKNKKRPGGARLKKIIEQIGARD